MPEEPVFSSGHLESLPWRVVGLHLGEYCLQMPGGRGEAVNHSAKWAEISALRSVQKVQDVVAREDTAGSGSSG